ncbi:hypothetical protein CAPTEDRAFT_150313 [Capitella teleta]|uniref:Ion transport domain-containing protein n=1 Tax=Capitella teleta TaxID=283909 RepID=R7V0G9_CAPTE|nr:hypothetical protein CAPTEDRAFT_150313 [Capitella teleta]|eukprot:ELU12333.1 hypothetical protein CAPTEDRAFT_150313 [Capitella teleta]
MIAFSVVTARGAAPQWKNISHHYENVPDVTVLSEKPNKLMALLAIVPSLYILSELFDLFGGYPYSIQFMYDKSLFAKFTKRLSTECVIVGNGPYRCVLFVHSISALAWLKHYLEGQETQLIPLSVSLLLGWIFLMFFTRGLSSTSRFSIMIQKMFFQDLMYFVAIFVLVMVAFTTSVMAMFSNVVRMRAGVANLMFAMLNIVVEIKDKDDIPLGSFPDFTQGLIICYTTIGVILMLNMLIAMMNTSYEAVRLTKENIWKQQQLSVLLMIERRLFWCRRVCLKSECKLWYKQWDHGTRAYIDVTTS